MAVEWKPVTIWFYVDDQIYSTPTRAEIEARLEVAI